MPRFQLSNDFDGQDFDVSVKIRVILFLLLREKCFQFLILIEVLCLEGHEG